MCDFMRLAAALLLLTLPATAADILKAEGDVLGDFKVVLNRTALDRSSPKALAESWGAVHAQEAAVADRFRVLFEEAHLDILRRYYAPDLLAQQTKNYEGKVRDVNALRCQFLEEKEGPDGRTLVYLRRAWTDGIGKPREDRAQLLVRKEKDGTFRLIEVRYLVGSTYERRDRTIPPPTARINVPGTFPPAKETPAGTFQRLFYEFRKLRFDRGNAQNELIKHFFTLTEEFYGKAVAAEARANQPAAKPRQEFFFKEKPAEELEGGVVRLTMMALEKAKGADAANVAGEAVFEMKKGSGKDGAAGWKVVSEGIRRLPGEPVEPVTKKIGLFLMG